MKEILKKSRLRGGVVELVYGQGGKIAVTYANGTDEYLVMKYNSFVALSGRLMRQGLAKWQN